MDWDLSSYFPSFNGVEMIEYKDCLKTDIAALKEKAKALASLTDDNIAGWEAIALGYEDIITRHRHLSSYMSCLTSADANSEAYNREYAALATLSAETAKLGVELLRGLKGIPDSVFDAFAGRPALADARHYLCRMRIQARYSMSLPEEELTADLGVDGIEAWGRLYDTLSGKLEFTMTYPDGKQERLSMSRRRALMEHSDRRIRKAAFEGGNEAWAGVETVAAAMLNAIAGARLTLNRHRGIDHFLDVALFHASISKPTLDAMFEAIYSEIELARRILRYRGSVMGARGVAWYDLGAALELPDQDAISWEKAKALVRDTFARSYPALGDYVQSMYDRRWIDWSPRPGKRPGAFCTGSPLTRESRVYMTFNDVMGDVQTLAHELGHAFHGYTMRNTRALARGYPMTLAESASTFGEMLLTRGLLSLPEISDTTRVFILNQETGHAATYLLDIPVRFEFEKAFYEERKSGELSVSRLKQLMSETQRRILGDALEEGGEDPYFWASKLHFYITGTTFYNFPYTFGFLLSRGLFSRFLKEGPDFLPRYEAFLQMSGSDTAEQVVKKTIGVDLDRPDFWVEAIKTVEEAQNHLEQVLPEVIQKHDMG